MRHKKYELVINILEVLGHGALAFTDIFTMAASGYPRRYLGKEKYKAMMQKIRKRHEKLGLIVEDIKERQRFYSLIYKLEKEGLIQKSKGESETKWFLTSRGNQKKEQLTEKMNKIKKSQSDLPEKNYQIEPSERPIVVIFDILEKESHKRDWLRDVLRNLDYKKLQKSVWLGNNKLPVELINDLKRLKILKCVKVFPLSDTGNVLV